MRLSNTVFTFSSLSYFVFSEQRFSVVEEKNLNASLNVCPGNFFFVVQIYAGKIDIPCLSPQFLEVSVILRSNDHRQQLINALQADVAR